MRDIKFRAWDDNLKVMFLPSELISTSYEEGYSHLDQTFVKTGHRITTPYDVDNEGMKPCVIMQYTGHHTISGQDLYEGDIVFIEEAEDDGDKRYYLVIVWIPEWSMFASLHLSEYKNFLEQGVDALDESMFWTYTLQSAEEDFHYAGNIYENPNLLEYEDTEA